MRGYERDMESPNTTTLPLPATDCAVARIVRGVPEDARREVSLLFFEAFGSKIGKVPGFPTDPDRIAEILSAILCPDRGYVAFDAHDVPVGCAWVAPRGELLCAKPEELKAAFGPVAGWLFALSAAPRRSDPDGVWQFEGFGVRACCRGFGIGSAMLERGIADAREAGATTLELTVADTNEGARRLYERFGFEVVKSRWLGPLARPAGFTYLQYMEKDLTAGARPHTDGVAP